VRPCNVFVELQRIRNCLTIIINVPWAPMSVHPKQHLDLFSHFCTVKPRWATWQTDWRTGWQTDTAHIGNNSLHLMHSIQPKTTIAIFISVQILILATFTLYSDWRPVDSDLDSTTSLYLVMSLSIAVYNLRNFVEDQAEKMDTKVSNNSFCTLKIGMHIERLLRLRAIDQNCNKNENGGYMTS